MGIRTGAVIALNAHAAGSVITIAPSILRDCCFLVLRTGGDDTAVFSYPLQPRLYISRQLVIGIIRASR